MMAKEFLNLTDSIVTIVNQYPFTKNDIETLFNKPVDGDFRIRLAAYRIDFYLDQAQLSEDGKRLAKYQCYKKLMN
jgi:hypothetical protein